MILASIDTNILLYAADSVGDAEKHRGAVDLLDRLSTAGRGVLALQALMEFYAVAVRKQRASPERASVLVPERASVLVGVWSDIFPVHEAAFADVADAIRVNRDHGIPL